MNGGDRAQYGNVLNAVDGEFCYMYFTRIKNFEIKKRDHHNNYSLNISCYYYWCHERSLVTSYLLQSSGIKMFILVPKVLNRKDELN